MAMPDPTTTRQAILSYVREHCATWGCGPTYDELGHRLGISKQAVAGHVAKLEECGLVTHVPASRNTLKTVDL